MRNFIKIQLHGQKPTVEQIAAAVVATGATAEQGAASAKSISAMLETSPQGNDFLTEFNNKIRQVWNDTHANATLYDRFKRDAEAPTVQAVVYQKIAPVDFNFDTDISDLADDEQCQTRKIPDIHSVLRSINLQQRFKTTSSQIEIDKIADGQAVSVDDIVANLGASYADNRTDKFISLVDGIAANKTGDRVNAMSTLAEVSQFIQDVKYYAFKFKEKRTDKYNAFSIAGDATAKSDTKMYPDQKPIVFIDPRRLFQVEGDYYATLFQIQQALPDVEFVEVDGFTGNKFAIMIDPRVIYWGVFVYQIWAEQMCGRPRGELNHYLYSEEIMAEFTCFDRVRWVTQAAAGVKIDNELETASE